MSDVQPPLSDALLDDLERLAVELATLAGAEIVSALGGELAIRYKGEQGAEATAWRDPVSDVDHRTEELIRERVSRAFPDHGVLGEEGDDVPSGPEGFVWAVDPVDGTTNFINGFPLFAASIGILHRGSPVVGAVWSSATHSLRPGVYHARRGGRLKFDSDVLELHANPAVRRRLMGSPYVGEDRDPRWDMRKTGSAAVECCFVAAGLLQVARFATPNVWDVAGGVPLVEASGGGIRDGADGTWRKFRGFDPDALHEWRGPLALGEEGAVDAACSLS